MFNALKDIARDALMLVLAVMTFGFALGFFYAMAEAGFTLALALFGGVF